MADPTDPIYKYSVNEYPTDGVKTQFEISFAGGYLSRDYIKVKFTDNAGAIRYPEFTFIGDFQISLSPALEAGGTLMIYRDTPVDQPIVDFQDGAIINEASLDINAKQAVHLAAEARDVVGSIPELDALTSASAALAFARSRANHTGVQGMATVTGLPELAAANSTYLSASAGIAATASGLEFAVSNADGTVTTYLNDDGVAVEQRTLATTAALAAIDGASRIGWGDNTVQNKLDWIDIYVTDLGAHPDNTGAQNLLAINAAIAKAKGTNGRGRIVFPAVTGRFADGEIPARGYRVSDQINFGSKLSVKMDAPILYEGPSTKDAVIYGEPNVTSKYQINQYLDIDVWIINTSAAPWNVSTSVGARLYTHRYCSIHLKEVLGFDRGYILHSDGPSSGYVYNEITVGEMRGNRVAMHWLCTNGGWLNDNNFYGGRASSSPAPSGHNSTSRYGLTMATDLNRFHNNVWYKFGAEIGHDAGTPEAIPIVLTDAYQNKFLAVRGEAHKGWVARITGNSDDNEIESSYGRLDASVPGPNSGNDTNFVDDQTAYKRNISYLVGQRLNRAYSRFSIDDIPSRYYADAAKGGFAGLGITLATPAHPTVNDPTRTSGVCTMTANGGAALPAASGRFAMRVRLNGARVLDVKCAANGEYTIYAKCYDASGALLYDPAIQYAKTLGVNGSGSSGTTQFGGCYVLTGVQRNAASVGLLPEVAFVDLLIGGNAAFVLYGAEVSTPQPFTINFVPYFPHKAAAAKPTLTTNIPEGCTVYNSAFTGSGAYGWTFLNGAWRDMGA